MRKLLRGRRRAWLALPVVLLVAGASSGVWLMTRDSSEAATSTTTTVSSQTIEQTVSADGTLAASSSSDESFAVSGTVTKVLVDPGDKVRKGAALALVDDTALLATRAAAASSLTAALTQLDEDVDNGESDVQVASDNAAVVSARASLADAREAVEDATLRASIAGTVSAVTIAKGDVAGSTASGMGGATDTSTATATTTTADTSTGTISIVSTDSYVVDATVAAEDAKDLEKGLQAEITATGVDDTIYGTVSEVGLVAQTNDSGAAVFPVTIEVTGKQEGLYAGVSATVSIVTQQIPDVLTVPTNALSTEEDGTTYVTEVVDGEDVKTDVETGQTYGTSTEITSGVEEGDEIVVATFRAPTGGGTGEQPQGGFPGGGEMPDFSQMGPPQ